MQTVVITLVFGFIAWVVWWALTTIDNGKEKKPC